MFGVGLQNGKFLLFAFNIQLQCTNIQYMSYNAYLTWRTTLTRMILIVTRCSSNLPHLAKLAAPLLSKHVNTNNHHHHHLVSNHLLNYVLPLLLLFLVDEVMFSLIKESSLWWTWLEVRSAKIFVNPLMSTNAKWLRAQVHDLLARRSVGRSCERAD